MNSKFSSFVVAILAALMVTMSVAFAAPPSVTFVASNNSVSISTQSSAASSAYGAGASVSYAATQISAYSPISISVGYSNPSVSIDGVAGGSINAQAYNLSAGNASGSASAVGYANSSLMGYAMQFGPSGFVVGSVSAAGSNSAYVFAGQSQDGYANTSYSGAVSLNGTPSGLSGTQSAFSDTNVGRITFSDGAPVGQTSATQYSNASAASYVDGTAGTQ